jgi:hypothetical protein
LPLPEHDLTGLPDIDAIIAQGIEAGGHRGMLLTGKLEGQVGTFALTPQIVDVVDVPVIAAGGVGDARGIVAALALGAAGVQIGTAYLFCPEAKISALHRFGREATISTACAYCEPSAIDRMLRQTCIKPEKPRWRAVTCDTSIILSPMKWPLSVMRSIAERPFS